MKKGHTHKQTTTSFAMTAVLIIIIALWVDAALGVGVEASVAASNGEHPYGRKRNPPFASQTCLHVRTRPGQVAGALCE